VSTILVVDDDSVTRRLIRGLLEAAGFAVTEAGDASAAILAAGRQRFDLALLDVWLPDMGGLELLESLMRVQPGIKVVIMTADEAPQTLLKAIGGRAHRYVRKPVEPDHLVQLVRQTLESPARPPRIEVLSAKAEWVELKVPCDLESARRIQSFLAHLDADLPSEVRDSVGQAFHELLMNAIEWGGGLDPGREVRISYLRARRMLLYRISDPGRGFSFESLPHAAVGQAEGVPLKHVDVREELGMRPGGFGLLMARALVDELIYNQAQNEVVFIKYLD
jgi:CheY-like chemotaxis protein/anti-sigma regulatory factor (Ser/Thr protein kinase)